MSMSEIQRLMMAKAAETAQKNGEDVIVIDFIHDTHKICNGSVETGMSRRFDVEQSNKEFKKGE